jgi:putative selenium metabolism protein SsnA
VGGRLVLPGLVNGHTHLCRALAPEFPADIAGSFHTLKDFWWRYERALGEEDIYLSAIVGLLDGVRGGVTTVIDHHSSPGAAKGSLEAVWRAFAEVGVRGCLSYAVSDRDGDAAANAGIDENRRFVEMCRARKSDVMSGLFGIDASNAVSDDTLRRVAQAANELDTGIHIHVAQDSSDLRETKSKYGKTPVERLISVRALRPKSLAVHCTHMESGDYSHLKSSRATAVHCSQSNAYNSIGVGSLHRLSSSGVRLALGTDGVSPHLFEEYRTAVLHQRLAGQAPSIANRLASRAAFAGNAEMATSLFGPPLGRIKPGARADLLVVDYDPPTELTPTNLPDHMFRGISRAPIQTVIVDGKIVHRNGAFPGLDEARIRARAREAANKLWERI